MEVEGSAGPASEGLAAASPARASDRAAAGTSKYLTNLPSRGLFSADFSSNLGGMRVYVCDHDTSPPEDQVIKTNTTNILIRALQLSKQRSESKDVNAKAPAESSRGKRSAFRAYDGRNPAKKANTGSASGISGQEGSSIGVPEKALQSLTVERLRALLKERGLSLRGKRMN
uniref:Uncharacterized protein LOC105051172 isoform X2 n=1 Tax=Elaeis guineensis var. tenera TaxID=51953 RepID=A0A6I9RNC7_ELAGV|nr:uncharacterized protein LOC105051172 isoform X2 [Elaeis guineensis]